MGIAGRRLFHFAVRIAAVWIQNDMGRNDGLDRTDVADDGRIGVGDVYEQRAVDGPKSIRDAVDDIVPLRSVHVAVHGFAAQGSHVDRRLGVAHRRHRVRGVGVLLLSFETAHVAVAGIRRRRSRRVRVSADRRIPVLE